MKPTTIIDTTILEPTGKNWSDIDLPIFCKRKDDNQIFMIGKRIRPGSMNPKYFIISMTTGLLINTDYNYISEAIGSDIVLQTTIQLKQL